MSDTTHTNLTRRYDRAARNWRGKMDRLGFGKAYQHLLAQFAPSTSPQTILDAGTGCGTFARAVLDYGVKVDRLDLLDPSAAMLGIARETIGAAQPVRCITGDIAGHHSASGYDLILCAHVIEHCDDPMTSLRQLRAMLRPGGRLVLAVSKPHWCSTLIFLRWRHKTFQPEAIVEMLREAGFGAISDYSFPKGPPNRVSHGYIAQNEGAH